MKRKPLTKLQRVKLFDDHQGVCVICHFKIDASLGAKWIVEHVKPLWLNGEDDVRNMGPAHYSCARQKTSEEAPVRAKSDRVRARHLGIRNRSKFPCSKDSLYKKKVDGTVVRREP
jgi:5-methylcytosine-specific restriction protein A